MDKDSVLQAGETGIARFRPGACLRITGEDALSFLQGQFTQELRPGKASAVVYGLWLTQKGKVLADSFVVRLAETEFFVFSYESRADVIRERLEAYIVADDVMVADVTADWSAESWFGREMAGMKMGKTPPKVGDFERFGEGFVFAGRRGREESWDFFGPRRSEALGRREEFVAIGSDEVERRRIMAAIPMVTRDLGPADLPAEGGLDEVAISYTKGCYLGQEVMARLKSMGRVRRRLSRVRGDGAVPAVPATIVCDGKVAGELRSVVAEGNGFLGLAMISLAAVGGGGSFALAENGAGLSLLDAQ